jgi:GT2 family glycosyltransferase
MNSPSKTPFVCSIVLAYGGTDGLFQCLESLSAQGVTQQIAIVQNGAPESLLERIAELYPEVSLIRNGGNVGAAAGRNIGIKWAESYHPDYLFFVDNDASLALDALANLIRAARSNTDAGFLGCVIYRKYEPNVVFSAGALMRHPLFDEHISKFDPKLKSYEADFVGTGAMLVPFDIVKSIGYFDEGLFVNYEDADWCLRGKRMGLRTLVVTKAVAYHDVPRAKFNPRQIYYTTRNRLIVAHRNRLFLSFKEKPVWQGIWSHGFKLILADDDAALTCATAYWLAVLHFNRGRLGECPHWMNIPKDQFAETRIRRRLRNTAPWQLARRVKHILLPS